MRVILIIKLTFLISFCNAQADQIDTLISRISNDQLNAICATPPDLKNINPASDSLIQIGKFAYNSYILYSSQVLKLHNDKSRLKESDSLVQLERRFYKIESEINDKLYKVLADQNKGIIAYYNLINIFGYYKTDYGLICLNPKDALIEYRYNGLKFFQDKNNKLFARKKDLKKVKQNWYDWVYKIVTVCCQTDN